MTAATERNRVLVVDDEVQILSAVEDLLEDDFDVVTASSAEEALRIVERCRIAVIISDQRMPGMNGDEFLASARELSAATRILITGYADLDAVVRAVNDGQIYAYLSKPWDPDHLQMLVSRAAEHSALLDELHEERQLLRYFMDNVPDLVYFKDRDRRYLRVNGTTARSLGAASPADVVGRHAADFFEPGTAAYIDAEERAIIEDGAPMLAVDPAGRVCGLIAIGRDIHDRRAAEEALRASDARLNLALEAARIATWDWEVVDDHFEWDRFVAALFGITPEEAPTDAAGFRALVHADDRAALTAALDACVDPLLAQVF